MGFFYSSSVVSRAAFIHAQGFAVFVSLSEGDAHNMRSVQPCFWLNAAWHGAQ